MQPQGTPNMKKYDVYGIGSALVDFEFEVSPQILKKYKIEKGVMTLVDNQKQAELMQYIDGVKHHKACGGSAANTMVALSQFGGKGFYSCRVADDEPGNFFFESLSKAGLETNLSARDRSTGHTGKCMVFVTPDADRTMNTYLGVNEQLSKNDVVEKSLKNSGYLYIEGYLAAFPSGLTAAIEAKRLAEKHEIKTSLTFSDPSMVTHCKVGLLELLGNGVDLLFCNEEEALLFTKTKEYRKAGNNLKQYARSYVMTRGARGALLYDGKNEYEIDAVKTNTIDTTGAGDTFAGAFLYAIARNYSYIEAGACGAMAASKVVSRFGPRLTAKETEDILSRIPKLLKKHKGRRV